MRVAIQIKGTEKWSKKIEKGDRNVYPASVTPTDSIHKGDRIYFRLQSGDHEMANGAFDRVEWNPVITYTATDSIADTDSAAIEQLSISNADGQKMYRFPAAEAAIYPQSGVTRVADYSAIFVSGTFEKAATTDSITLKVVQANDSLTQSHVIYERGFAAFETYSGDLTIDVPASSIAQVFSPIL